MGIRHGIAMHVCGIVNVGRDAVLDEFLKGENDKLFWIDSDMVWSPDDFLRLLALSTKFDCVGATYPAKVEGPPTFYVNRQDGFGEYGLMKVGGLGLGFTIVSRDVCQRLADRAPKYTDQISGVERAQVFRVDIADGNLRTEDMAFFADITDLGVDVWLDPSIELGHIGEREWRGSVMDALKPKAVA
jgi:hypothetical protein